MPRSLNSHSINARLPDETFAVVAERAERLGQSISQATRELVDLGGVLDSMQRHGVVWTDEAVALSGAGGASVVPTSGWTRELLDQVAAAGEGWAADERTRAAVLAGAVVLATAEQAYHLERGSWLVS